MIKENNNMSILDNQIGGNHYMKYSYQPIQFFEDIKLNFTSSCIIKYILRYKDKNGIEDLAKALHFSEFGITINRSIRANYQTIQPFIDRFISQLDSKEQCCEIKTILSAIDYNYINCYNDIMLVMDKYSNTYNPKEIEFLLNKSNEHIKGLGYKVGSIFNNKHRHCAEYTICKAVVFSLHKYEVLDQKISKFFNVTQSRIRTIIDEAYKDLNNDDKSFIYEMNTFFDFMDNELKIFKHE